MREYTAIKPTVYVETSVVSYLTSLPSRDSLVLSRQEVTRQLWNEYFDNFEFIVSNIVISEIRKGDEKEVQSRLKAIADFRILEKSPAADRLTQLLLDSGAVPGNSRSDAQHISIATVYSLDYLIHGILNILSMKQSGSILTEYVAPLGMDLQPFVLY